MATESRVGKTIGKYQLVEQLGRGGMAEVYKAYQPGLDRHVAVKLMLPVLAEDKGFLTRFQREAKLVAAMRHPNIVQVHDFDVEGGVYYMVMEFIDGETLKDRLERLEQQNQWVSLDEATRIILSVGSALKYAHRQGMVHRDVKPANVMIDRQGNIILTDFGIAKMVAGGGATQLTATGALVGTPLYMAPEQGLGQPGDERSDIYSLGVMLYQLVTGQVPYQADTPMAVVLKHISDPLPAPRLVNPAVPSSIESILLRALAKNPDERYQHVGEMLNDLKRAMGLSLDETPTDTMRGRALPTGAGAADAGAITPFPAASRAGAGQAAGSIAAPSSAARPTRQAKSDFLPVALGALIVLLIAAIVVIAFLVVSRLQNDQRAAGATATAQAMITSNPTPTASATPTPSNTPTPSSFAGVVSTNDAQLHSSPSGNSPAIGLLPQNARLIIRARSADNAWLKVEAADGTTGWVATKAINLGSAPLDAIPQAVLLVQTSTVAATPSETPALSATPESGLTPTATRSGPTSTPGPTQPIPTTRPGTLFDFEGPVNWRRGDQPNGTLTQSTQQAHSGQASARLDYNFPGGGNDFVVFINEVTLSGLPNAIGAWVYGDGSGHFMNVWIKDNAGQVWQVPLGRVGAPGWRQMTGYIAAGQPWPWTHISGPDNGQVDYPIRFYALVLDDTPDSYSGSGTIYIDDITAWRSDKAPTSATPGVPPTSGAPATRAAGAPTSAPTVANEPRAITLQTPRNGECFKSSVIRFSWVGGALQPGETFQVEIIPKEADKGGCTEDYGSGGRQYGPLQTDHEWTTDITQRPVGKFQPCDGRIEWVVHIHDASGKIVQSTPRWYFEWKRLGCTP